MALFSANRTNIARRRTLIDRVTTGDTRPHAFYGIEKRHLLDGWPTTSGAHDAAYYLTVNSGGLAGPWRLWSERFTPAGRWFFIASGALFLSGVNSLELQAYVPLIYAACLWLCAFAAYWRGRPRAALRAVHGDRVCA